MAGILIYSPKCKHCVDIIGFIQSKQEFKNIVTFHNATTLGIPSQFRSKITVVPTMITKNSKFLTGAEIKQWLLSLIPTDISNHTFSQGCSLSSIDNDDTEDGLFNISNYGQSLQPAITPEIEKRINQSVMEAYNEHKN
tara:strand:+ start:563 stop:979 length:417 start_codon:yes stop_codon:yes gene_type:complete